MKIINDELRVRMRKNPIRYKSLYEMLMKIIEKYNIRLIDTADVIRELIEIAKEIRKNLEEGNKLDLSEEELVFYDLLNSRIGRFKNRDTLKRVVKEILKELNPYIRVADWNKKDSIRAKIKMIVKKTLINIVDSKMSYNEINAIASKMLNQMEIVYAAV